MCISPLIASTNELIRPNAQLHYKEWKLRQMVSKPLRFHFGMKLQDFTPKSLRDNISTQEYMFLPCGNCLECTARKANLWTNRNILELQAHDPDKCWFITWTFNPKQYRKTKTPLHDYQNELQKALKRVRRYQEYTFGNKLRCFNVAEYGGKNGRKHYHSIIYNMELTDLLPDGDYFTSKKLTELWSFGDVKIGRVSAKSIAYVANYTSEKMQNRQAVLKSLNETCKNYGKYLNRTNKMRYMRMYFGFKTYSRGLGCSTMLNNLDGFYVDGKKRYVPASMLRKHLKSCIETDMAVWNAYKRSIQATQDMLREQYTDDYHISHATKYRDKMRRLPSRDTGISYLHDRKIGTREQKMRTVALELLDNQCTDDTTYLSFDVPYDLIAQQELLDRQIKYSFDKYIADFWDELLNDGYCYANTLDKS